MPGFLFCEVEDWNLIRDPWRVGRANRLWDIKASNPAPATKTKPAFMAGFLLFSLSADRGGLPEVDSHAAQVEVGHQADLVTLEVQDNAL